MGNWAMSKVTVNHLTCCFCFVFLQVMQCGWADRHCTDSSHVTHSGIGNAGGSDPHLTHDLLTVNRSDPVTILSPQQRGMHAFVEPVCMPARLLVIFTFSSQVWLAGLAALVSHLMVLKKKVFSGLAAKRTEHSECLIWQVAAFLISTM